MFQNAPMVGGLWEEDSEFWGLFFTHCGFLISSLSTRLSKTQDSHRYQKKHSSSDAASHSAFNVSQSLCGIKCQFISRWNDWFDWQHDYVEKKSVTEMTRVKWQLM